MTYLCILFISPLYFLLRKRWGSFIVNSFFWCSAWLCVLTLFLIPIAPLFWFVGIGMAAWSYRREMMEEHATMMATKMAEALRQHQSHPLPPQEPS